MKKVHERHNTKVVVVVLFIVVLLAVFFIGREFFRVKDQSFVYHNVDFTRVNEGRVERFQFPMYINNASQPITAEIRSDPRDLVGITYDVGLRDVLLSKKQVFVTMNKSATGLSVAAYTELKYFLANPSLWGVNTTGAFIEPTSTYPVKTCADVSVTDGVVEFVIGSKNKIVLQDGCVRLFAVAEADVVKVVDKLVLILVGIDE